MRCFDGEVEIVPGVVGPAEVRDDRYVLVPGGQRIELLIRFDEEARRYVCAELVMRQEQNAAVTTEALRQVPISDYMVMSLLLESPIRDLPNPDGVEPWGRMAPAGLADEGPTDRALRWVAHVYRFALAVEHKPTNAVEETFGLSRATAGRWIATARKRGLLGPAALGRAGG